MSYYLHKSISEQRKEAEKSVVRLQLGKSFDLRVRIHEKRTNYIGSELFRFRPSFKVDIKFERSRPENMRTFTANIK